MTEERLKEIKDSIDLQLEACKIFKQDNELTLEEIELYNEVVRLRELINKEVVKRGSFIRYNDVVYIDMIKYKNSEEKLEKANKKIDKLNNIINELENYLSWVIEYTLNNDEKGTCKSVLDKLKELKENK